MRNRCALFFLAFLIAYPASGYAADSDAFALAAQGAPPMLDIVLIIETGGRMYRLLPDAADFAAGFARIMQTALPPPDVRFGGIRFSSDDRAEMSDLSDSPAAFAQELRQTRAAPGSVNISLETIFKKLVHSYSWRPGSRRFAILYMGSRIRAVPRALDQLRAPGITLITIPADGASTAAHEILQTMADRTGGVPLIPDYLVRYSDANRQRRAFYLYKRSLYPLAHDVPEQNWQDVYESIEAAGIRSYRSGSIDESCEILGRLGVRGIRIMEIQSTLARACAEAIALRCKDAAMRFPAPDMLMRFTHARRAFLIPAAGAYISRVAAPENTAWLGFMPIRDSRHEDGFFPHPASFVLLPAAQRPPASLLVPWRDIASRMPRIFSTGRVFVEARSVALTPIAKKRFTGDPPL
ncbi:MAG: hypothetical protein LBC99_03140 [Spirochaetota bacterium]|jgi:hypothetical protein|nr:hypothetical protein [Spirochaetota bacterium]